MEFSLKRNRIRVASLFKLAVVGSCLVLAAACGGGTGGGNNETVKVGFLYDVHAANVWTMGECSTAGTKFELVNFKQFAEVQRAFQTGQIDAAAMGYQNMAQMLEAEYSDFSAVSGVYTGAEHITVRKGSGVKKWSDLVGKKIGIPPNSFVEMLFRSAWKEQGLNIKDVDIVPFAGAGPPMRAALQRGDIDAMVAWEPNSAQAFVDGVGEYPPFDIQDGSIGKATSVMYVSGSMTKDRPKQVDELLKCLSERTDALNKDHDAWVKALKVKTGISAAVAAKAISTGTMDVKLYSDSAAKIIKAFSEAGLVKDSSDQIPKKFDYKPLEKLTGKSRKELGG